MDIEKLKTTWSKLKSENLLDEGQLKKILDKRTKSLIERIDRNIKIGILVLFVLILFFAIDDFFLSPFLLNELGENPEIPGWIVYLGAFSNILIFTTFIYFVIKYYRVKKSCETICDLKVTLIKTIDTLKIYQTMFYLTLAILLFSIAMGFLSGLHRGFLDLVNEKGIPLDDVQLDKIVLVGLIGFAVILLITGAVFLFLRWGFNKLYGNYIKKLKLTLQELQDIED